MSGNDKIPAQFRGLARQLWREVTAEDQVFLPAFDHITAPVRQRVRKHPNRDLRDGTLNLLANQWAALPDDFRIVMRSRIDRRGRRGDIVDLRMRPSRLIIEGDNAWDELALDICSLCVDFPLRPDSRAPQTLASIGFHALGRRFQRCPDHSRDALMTDFAKLVAANVNDETKFPTGERFDIQTPRGAWRGVTDAVRENGEVVVHFLVRTFVDNV